MASFLDCLRSTLWYKYVYVHISTYAQVHAHTRTHARTRACARAHTHTHTQARAPRSLPCFIDVYFSVRKQISSKKNSSTKHKQGGSMLEIFSHYILVDDRSLSVDALVSRKWDRSHLGKPSYKEQNVSLHHYRVYFEGWIYFPLTLFPQTHICSTFFTCAK